MRRRIERQLADSIEADEEQEDLPLGVELVSPRIPEQFPAVAPAVLAASVLGPKPLPPIGAGARSRVKARPPEMSSPDYLIMLLHTGAEIEHCLMVQYLYAAYSLGGEQVPVGANRDMVRQWRESILTVAREEMGHLLCIQNALTLVGGPVSLERTDFPAQGVFYPFAFRLEPLSLASLACYVKAEMPPDDELKQMQEKQGRYKDFGRYKTEIDQLLDQRPGLEHRVGEIYDAIDYVAEHELEDSDLHPETYGLQASWDEWGRGYQLDRPGVDQDGGGHQQQRPAKDAAAKSLAKEGAREGRVIVQQMATRSQALAVLRKVAGQGEAPHVQLDRNERADQKNEGPSHFERFFGIYGDWHNHFVDAKESWSPTRPVPVNPTTFKPSAKQNGDASFDAPSDGEPSCKNWKDWVEFARPTWIASRRSRLWANLFNLRYRMLLTYLAHTYRLPRATAGGEPGVRNATLHRVFCEMYNLKTIGGILVELPLHDGPTGDALDNGQRAGPPFEMPYTMELPLLDVDCWDVHKDLLLSSQQLCRKLMEKSPPPGGERYLSTLTQLDKKSLEWIDSILNGLGVRNRT